MKHESILKVEVPNYVQVSSASGFGTRPSAIVKRPEGRRYFLLKNHKNALGELRSEYLASVVGKMFGFPVPDVHLCKVGATLKRRLPLNSQLAILSKIDVRRQRDTLRGYADLEEFIHGEQLMQEALGAIPNYTYNRSRRFYTFANIDKAFDLYEKNHPEAKNLIRQQFFDICIFDCLIGGSDRHGLNWAVLESLPGRKFLRMAKAFDNGVSLLWNFEATPRSQQLGDIAFNRRYLVEHCKSAIRKDSGGQYNLFEAVKVMIERGYCDTSHLADLRQKIISVSEVQIEHKIIEKPPINKSFLMNKQALAVICAYLLKRRTLLVAMLDGYAPRPQSPQQDLLSLLQR